MRSRRPSPRATKRICGGAGRPAAAGRLPCADGRGGRLLRLRRRGRGRHDQDDPPGTHVFGERRDWTPAEVKASWARIKAERRPSARNDSARRQAARACSTASQPHSPPRSAQSSSRTRRPRSASTGGDRAGRRQGRRGDRRAQQALANGSEAEIAEELGDLLFVLANIARWKGLDPDQVLRAANTKFERRFKAVEQMLQARGKSRRRATSPRWMRCGAKRRSCRPAGDTEAEPATLHRLQQHVLLLAERQLDGAVVDSVTFRQHLPSVGHERVVDAQATAWTCGGPR